MVLILFISHDKIFICDIDHFSNYLWYHVSSISDYKKLDVYISSDTDPESDEYQAILQEGLRIIARLDILQTANGVPDAFSYIEFTVIDKDTGEILAQRRYRG